MARKQVNDLEGVNIQGAAQQVNTFVYGPRAERENSASKLAEALTKGVKGIQDYQEIETQLNVAQATENKLYGGTLYTNREAEGIADYDEIKESLGSMEAAEKYFLERTAPPEDVADAHALAGYRENQAKGLGKFRGQHAQYLSKLKAETRSRDVLNDFMTNVDYAFTASKLPNSIAEANPSPKAAFDRLAQIADNFGINKKDTNAIPLGVAEVLVAQGKMDAAEAILKYNRGAAGSLLSNPQTALEAEKIMNNVVTENRVATADTIKRFEDKSLAGVAFDPTDRAVMDSLLDKKLLTIEQRNNLLTKNDEAVKVDRFSEQLKTNMVQEGRSFFDPIVGATTEETQKARDKFTEKFYDDIEQKRAKGTIDPEGYTKRNIMFAEQTNSTNPEVKRRLGVGMSAFNPEEVLKTGQVDAQSISAVAEYMMMHNQNPNVAAAHLSNDKATKFYDDLVMDIKFGTGEGDMNTRIQTALLNYAKDATNPLKGTGDLRVTDEEIMNSFTTATKKAADISWDVTSPNQGPAANALQWMPYIKRQIQEASRRTGSLDKTELMNHVVKQIVSRSQRIGDYLVPRGTNTIIGSHQELEKINEATVNDYITKNPEAGYTADELVITPIIGQENMWGVSVKGSNAILEVIPQDQLRSRLPAADQELPQIIQDEGTKTNAKGEHVSYLDSEGYLTGGHGHLMTPEEKALYPEGTPIPKEVADAWLATDKAEAEQDVVAVFGEVEEPEVKKILTNMAFNLGRTKLNEFTRLKKAIKDKDYKLAAQSMRESKWAKQVGTRADRLIDRVEQLT